MRKKLKFEQIRRDNSASFRYGYSRLPYQDEISLHFHPEIEIKYIFKGSGYRMTGDFLESFNEGELVFSPSNLPHCWIYSPESCIPDGNRGCIFVQFLPELLKKGLSFFSELEYASRRLLEIKQGMKITGETGGKVIDILKTMSQQNADEKLLSLIRIIQLLGVSTDIIPIGMPNNKPNDITRNMQRMQIIYKYVVEHYKKKITLKDISDAVTMSSTAFCSFFKWETGKTFNSFLNEYRIEIVCNLLRNFPEEEIKLPGNVDFMIYPISIGLLKR